MEPAGAGESALKNATIGRTTQPSACAAASTSAAWPGTFTFDQICATLPSRPMRKVDRSMPMYFLPYMLFSTQTP